MANDLQMRVDRYFESLIPNLFPKREKLAFIFSSCLESGHQKYLKLKKEKFLCDSVVNYFYALGKILASDDLDSVPIDDDSFESESFQSKYLTEEWCQQFKRLWGHSQWAEILFATSHGRGSALGVEHRAMLENSFSKFLSMLRQKKWTSKDVLERHSCDILHYLQSHTLDISNSLVGGAVPQQMSKYFEPMSHVSASEAEAVKEVRSRLLQGSYYNLVDLLLRWDMMAGCDSYERIGKEVAIIAYNMRKVQFQILKGSLVAVAYEDMPTGSGGASHRLVTPGDIDSFFVFARLAAPVEHMTTNTDVELFFTPAETAKVLVPISKVFVLNLTSLSEVEQNNVVPSNPMSIIGEALNKYTEERVRKALAAAFDLSLLEEKNFSFTDIPKVFGTSKIIANFHSELPLLIDQKHLTDKIDNLIARFPLFTFSVPGMARDFMGKHERFISRLPKLVPLQIKCITQLFEGRLNSVRGRIASVISGKRKNEVCDWWLSLIESRVDSYLSKHGYIPNSIPENYTDERPKCLDTVIFNFNLLNDTLSGRVDDEEFFHFIDSTTKEIYEVLDAFKAELHYLIHDQWEGWVSGVTFTEEDRKRLECDHEYLVEMKAMDEEIFRLKRNKDDGATDRKRIEMTSVVPISGLLIARFQMYSCELQTVIDMWKPKEVSAKKPSLAFEARQKGAVGLGFDDEEAAPDPPVDRKHSSDPPLPTYSSNSFDYLFSGRLKVDQVADNPKSVPFLSPLRLRARVNLNLNKKKSGSRKSNFGDKGESSTSMRSLVPNEASVSMRSLGTRNFFESLSPDKMTLDRSSMLSLDEMPMEENPIRRRAMLVNSQLVVANPITVTLDSADRHISPPSSSIVLSDSENSQDRKEVVSPTILSDEDGSGSTISQMRAPKRTLRIKGKSVKKEVRDSGSHVVSERKGREEKKKTEKSERRGEGGLENAFSSS